MYSKIIEQVKEINYLGSNSHIKKEEDMKKFNHITGTIRRALKHKAWKESVIKLYKSMAVATLTYGSETRTMSARQISRVQATEIKFWRSIACLLYTSRCV